jgi:hypothetical protein
MACNVSTIGDDTKNGKTNKWELHRLKELRLKVLRNRESVNMLIH